MAFKNENRYASPKELQIEFPYLHVLRIESEIVGAIKIVMSEDKQTVFMGPVAVPPKYQVSDNFDNSNSTDFRCKCFFRV